MQKLIAVNGHGKISWKNHETKQHMILSDFKWWLPKPLNIYTILLVKLHLPYIHKFPSQFTIVTHVVVDDALLQVVVVAFSSHARIWENV